jgi:hypothetical protein
MVEAGSQAKTKIKLMTHVFKHPKFYRIPRDKSDQAISKRQPTGESERATWSGPQASSDKPASNKQQAGEAQASSYKRSSHK